MIERKTVSNALGSVFFGAKKEDKKLLNVRLEHICRDPNQPRQRFVEADIQTLAASIKAVGLAQPIGVMLLPEELREGDACYRIVFGERRWRAHLLLQSSSEPGESEQWATIAAIVRPYKSASALSIIENLQRVDLTHIETAEAMQRLIDEQDFTHAELAAATGMARSTVSELLSLLRLAPSIREHCRSSDSHSKSALLELSKLESDTQLAIWPELAEGGTIENVRSLAAALLPAPGKVAAEQKKPVVKQTRHNLFSGEIARKEGPVRLNVQVSVAPGADEVTPQELIAFFQNAIADLEAKI